MSRGPRTGTKFLARDEEDSGVAVSASWYEMRSRRRTGRLPRYAAMGVVTAKADTMASRETFKAFEKVLPFCQIAT